MITREIAQASLQAKPLGEVAEFLDSRRKPVKQADRKPGPYPYYGANGQQGTIDGFIFDEPLILLAEDGGFFDDPDRGIAYRIQGKSWVNNHAHVIKPKEGLDLSYLCRVLENYDVRPFINGSTRSKLTKTQASQIPIPLPPLDEQKRIAAILDQADALRRLRQRAIDRLNTLGQAIFHEMFGDPAKPKSFNTQHSVAPLQDIVEIKGGGTPSKSKAEYYRGDIPWVTPKDMKVWNIFESQDKITEEAVKNSATNLIPPNSVLIVNRSGILKHTLPIGINRKEVAINQDMKALICGESMLVDFVAHLLKAAEPLILTWVRATTADNFPIDNLKKLPVPIPPREEQELFQEKISEIETQVTKFKRSQSEIEKLFASLQGRAFCGEL